MNHACCAAGAIAVSAMLSLTGTALAAQFTTLHTFAGGGKGVNGSTNGVILKDGKLFGVTRNGGRNDCTDGCGTIYMLEPTADPAVWVKTILFKFKGGAYGQYPEGNLAVGLDGELYGVTIRGGDGGCMEGCGTVYRLTPPATAGTPWKHRVLHSFQSGTSDGRYPVAGPVYRNGALYGTTEAAGTFGQGVVFKLARVGGVWTNTILHNFGAAGDGKLPNGPMILGADDRLYGATVYGGISDYGTIYQLTPPAAGQTDWTYQVLHKFNGTKGRGPQAMKLAPHGKALYGVTLGGGNTAAPCHGVIGCGVVFRLRKPAPGQTDWTYQVLHKFAGGLGGDNPYGLAVDGDGNLFGTTNGGGAANWGTVFQLAPPVEAGAPWTKTILHELSAAQGQSRVPMTVDNDGNVYGGTYNFGSTTHHGSVFRIVP